MQAGKPQQCNGDFISLLQQSHLLKGITLKNVTFQGEKCNSNMHDDEGD